MTDSQTPSADPPASPGSHLTTISHEGRFWEVYLEFEDETTASDTYRAALRFVPADQNDGEESLRTAAIIIEYSYEEAVAKARSFSDRQLAGLLRSLLPG